MRPSLLLILAFLIPAEAAPEEVQIVVRYHGVSGAPDAPVSVSGVARPRTVQARTPPAADRQFELSAPGREALDLEPGTWLFELSREGFWSDSRAVQIEKGGNPVELDLWPTGTIKAIVQSPQGEKPPARLTVHFAPVPSKGHREMGPTGMIHCPVLGTSWRCEVPAGRLDLRLGAAGYVSLYRWGAEVAPTRELDLGRFEIRRGNSVLGWVETEIGETAVDTQIVLRPLSLRRHRNAVSRERMERLEQTAQTNDRGFFHIDGVRPGKYVLEAKKQAFAPARATVEVINGEETIIANPSLMLKKAIRVEVYVDPPVPPLGEEWLIEVKQVDQQSQTIGVLDQAVVSASGFWSHDSVPPGRYWFRITTEDDSSWFAEIKEVGSNTPAVFIEIPVIEVRGEVLWGREPLPATVRFGGEYGPVQVALQADEEGRFAGLIPRPGTWKVEVTGKEAPVQRTFSKLEITRKPGKTHAEIEIRIPDTKLEVLVVNDSGVPVPDALVTLQSHEEVEPAVSEQSNAEGVCQIAGVPPGLATVSAKASLRGTRLASEEMAINLTDDGETSRVRLVLRPQTKIRGRIVADGLGIPGARIKAEPVNVRGLLIPLQVTDADGNFEAFISFYTSEFFLSVAAPGFAFRFLRLPVDPEVPLVIPVSKEGGTLIVDVPPWQSSGARDIPPVFLYHEGGREALGYLRSWAEFGEPIQGEGNTYHMPRMEPGEYTVCLTHPANLITAVPGPGPGDRCAGGYLPAFGELRLSLVGGRDTELGSPR